MGSFKSDTMSSEIILSISIQHAIRISVSMRSTAHVIDSWKCFVHGTKNRNKTEQRETESEFESLDEKTGAQYTISTVCKLMSK